MTTRMRRNANFIKSLAGGEIEKILDKSTDDQLNATSELVYNALQGILPLSEKSKSKLRDHKEYLRRFSEAGTHPNHRRKVLQEGGGVFAKSLGKIARKAIKRGPKMVAKAAKGIAKNKQVRGLALSGIKEGATYAVNQIGAKAQQQPQPPPPPSQPIPPGESTAQPVPRKKKKDPLKKVLRKLKRLERLQQQGRRQ